MENLYALATSSGCSSVGVITTLCVSNTVPYITIASYLSVLYVLISTFYCEGQCSSNHEVATCGQSESHSVNVCLTIQGNVSTSCPFYTFYISYSLCILRFIIVLNSFQSTCYIYVLTSYQFWRCIWDSSQQLCGHSYRSYDRSDNVVIYSNSSLSLYTYRPCQQCRIDQRRDDMFLTKSIYIFRSVADKFCYIIDYSIFLALLNDACDIYIQVVAIVCWYASCEVCVANSLGGLTQLDEF